MNKNTYLVDMSLNTYVADMNDINLNNQDFKADHFTYKNLSLEHR